MPFLESLARRMIGEVGKALFESVSRGVDRERYDRSPPGPVEPKDAIYYVMWKVQRTAFWSGRVTRHSYSAGPFTLEGAEDYVVALPENESFKITCEPPATPEAAADE